MKKFVLSSLCLFIILGFGFVSVSADSLNYDLEYVNSHTFVSSDVSNVSVDSNSYKLYITQSNLYCVFWWNAEISSFVLNVYFNDELVQEITNNAINLYETIDASIVSIDINIDNNNVIYFSPPIENESSPIYQGIYDLYVKLIYGNGENLSSTDVGVLTYLSLLTTILLFIAPFALVFVILKRVLE